MFDLPRIYPHVALRDLERPEDLVPNLPDADGLGERAWQIAARLRVSEGQHAGACFGEVATPWQEKFIRALFGHTRNGRRIFRRALLLTARKNGKTLLGAVVAMTACILDAEPRGQILMLAQQRDQAKICYRNVCEFVRLDAALGKRFHVADYRHEIIDITTQAAIRAIATEAGNIIGAGPSVAMIDELHMLGLLGERGLDLVHGLESGMLAREQPLSVFISTAPVQTSAGIYREVTEHAWRVFNGEEDDRRLLFLPFVIPPELDFEDAAHWWRSNPCVGVTLKLADLIERREQAQARGPAAMSEFLSQNLNIEPANREGAVDVWIKAGDWAAAEDATITLETLLKRCNDVTLGIDAGGANDLTAAVALGRDEAGKFIAWSRHWLSRRGFEEQKNRGPFAEALEAGELAVVPNVGEDVVELLALVRTLRAKLRGVGCDPYGLKEASLEIQKITGREVLGVPQGWRLSPYLDEVERAVLAGKLKHHRSALLDWQISNSRVQYRGEARALTKPDQVADSPRKIDGVIALVCAFAAMQTLPPSPEYKIFFVG